MREKGKKEKEEGARKRSPPFPDLPEEREKGKKGVRAKKGERENEKEKRKGQGRNVSPFRRGKGKKKKRIKSVFFSFFNLHRKKERSKKEGILVSSLDSLKEERKWRKGKPRSSSFFPSPATKKGDTERKKEELTASLTS